jgi:hypothetical protein
MIRYKVTKKNLEKLIEAESPKWLESASLKTAGFKKLKRYKETGKKGANWRSVVKVYMNIQRNKCAYCERKLEGGDAGTIEHDIEHFRPKSKVRGWPTAKLKKELQLDYKFTTGEASDVGYYLLPYNIFNYITSCKVCNTIFKSDYFPISGKKRLTDSDDFKKLKTEKPFLLYPLGSIDVDPQKVITFQGMIPIAVAAEGKANYYRARVTIDFFRLGVAREDLIRERALVIKALYLAYQNRNSRNRVNREDALLTIDMALSDSAPHANCARSFYSTCRDDPPMARKYYDAAVAYLKSKGY